MSTFTKRATPRQCVVFRMIRGAVWNAADCHPNWEIDRRYAASIAKRAAGTLTAGWPEVLAAPLVPSEEAGDGFAAPVSRRGRSMSMKRSAGEGPTNSYGPSHRRTQRLLGAMASQARKAGMVEREKALTDALRLLASAAELPSHGKIDLPVLAPP